MRRRQVAVVGASSGPDDLMYTAEKLGRVLVDAGFRIVCGGGSGVMEAVARGARRSEHATGSDVIGILKGLDPSDANPYVDIVLPTGMAHARNALVAAAGDAVVALGGGAGTLSEVALAWRMGRPVVAFENHSGWAARLAGECLDPRRNDTVIAVRTPEEAVAAVERALSS